MSDIEETKHTKLTWVVNNGQKIKSNNTSGIRGVCRANGKWAARITFQKETYWLGTFDKKKDAAIARKEAEEHLYVNFLDWYKNKYNER